MNSDSYRTLEGHLKLIRLEMDPTGVLKLQASKDRLIVQQHYWRGAQWSKMLYTNTQTRCNEVELFWLPQGL